MNRSVTLLRGERATGLYLGAALLVLTMAVGVETPHIHARMLALALYVVLAYVALRDERGIVVVLAPVLLVPAIHDRAGIQGRLLLGGAALLFAILYWRSGGKRAPLPRLPLYAVGVAAGVLVFESVLHGTKFQTALQVPVICAAGLILGACVAQSDRAFLALALFMAPLALLAVAEIAGFHNPWPALVHSTQYVRLSDVAGAQRAQSTFGHPLIAGGVFAVMSALVVARPTTRFRLPLASLLAAGALATVSRSAILGLAAAAGVMIVLSSQHSRLRSISTIVVVVAVGWTLVTTIPALHASFIARVGNASTANQNVRTYAIDRVSHDLSSDPGGLLIGGGVGASSRLLNEIGGIDGLAIFDDQYVTSIYDLGLLPFAAIAVLLLAGLKRASAASRRAGLPAVAAALGVLGFTDGLYWLSLAVVTSIAVGAACAPPRDG